MRNWVAGVALVFFSLTAMANDDEKLANNAGPSCIVLASADFALTDLVSLPVLQGLQKSLAADQKKYLDDMVWVNGLQVSYQLDYEMLMATLFPNIPNNDPVKVAACHEQAALRMGNTIAADLLSKADEGYQHLNYYFGHSPRMTKARIDNIADLIVVQRYLTTFQLTVVTDLIELYRTKGNPSDADLVEAIRQYSRRAARNMELPKSARLIASAPKLRLEGFVKERVEHFAATGKLPQFARDFAQRQLEFQTMFTGYFPMPSAWADYLWLLEVGIREAK